MKDELILHFFSYIIPLTSYLYSQSSFVGSIDSFRL